ncbi:TPA: hypothetical protein I4D05_09150 [Enterobacter hormaechei]|nr:hypothetical protein D0Z05_12965 [Enterobacter hormaechei]RTO51782.1 hypothetical protein EKN64_11310 [Enterobacter hormaechei]TQD37067.1 hypothetical protein FKC79_02195 [Enterobacter hormaechei]HAS1290198.1 hypothetical protein [Enterobacter hormaechei]HAS1541069.1 hypothetical protein [Enterobacter hormaechei]
MTRCDTSARCCCSCSPGWISGRLVPSGTVCRTKDLSGRPPVKAISTSVSSGGNWNIPESLLGHTDIKMTIRYAHFAPDHPEDAVRFNPLCASKGELVSS